MDEYNKEIRRTEANIYVTYVTMWFQKKICETNSFNKFKFNENHNRHIEY